MSGNALSQRGNHLTRHRVPPRVPPKKELLLSLSPNTRISIHHSPPPPPSYPPPTTTHTYTHIGIMSSPATRRTRASNKSSTPSRSSREPPSSPTMRESTPRAARALAAERNIPSSSPAAYQSSPMGQQTAETPDVRMGDASSQLDDGDRTPRANQGVRGMLEEFFLRNFFLLHLVPIVPLDTNIERQTLLRSVILQAPVLRVVWVDPISALTSVPMP